MWDKDEHRRGRDFKLKFHTVKSRNEVIVYSFVCWYLDLGHKANHSILEHYFDIDFVSCSIEKFYFLKNITTPESFKLRIYNAIKSPPYEGIFRVFFICGKNLWLLWTRGSVGKLGEEKQNVRRRVKKVNRDRYLFVKPVYRWAHLRETRMKVTVT